MSRIVRVALLLAIVALMLVSAYTILAFMRSDAALDRGDPAAALRARPDNPEALMQLADERLAVGDMPKVEVLAKRLLASSPAEGRGYRLLAQVSESRGEYARAEKLYAIAAQRAPRDLQARAWLAQRALAAGNYPLALQHIDQVLRTSPGSHARLFPVLIQFSQDVDFADAVAKAMTSHPEWREGLLSALLDPVTGNPLAADHVLAGLQRRRDLDAVTTQAWIEALMHQGRWGSAFARWAGPHVASGRALPLLFNGDFTSTPEGSGFDWRLPPVAGVLVAIEPNGSAGMLHVRFLGRRVSGGPVVSHALMLTPGKYRLTWRERIDAMRAGIGVAWRISCDGQSQSLLEAEPSNGTRPWRDQTSTFTVPADRCGGQWLELTGSGNAGAGQIVSGDLWYSDMGLTKVMK